MLLDISQGSRVSLAAYEPEDPPPVELAVLAGRGFAGLPGADGRALGFLRGWTDVVRRADDAPGGRAPGPACARRSPAARATRGCAAGQQGEAIPAGDTDGEVDEVSLGPARNLATRTQRLLSDHRLVVVGLPPGRPGDATLDAPRCARGRRATW